MPEAITPKEAFKRMQESQDQPEIAIIDVRSPGEYKAGHIPGSVNMDLRTPVFFDSLRSMDKGKNYIIYCQAGIRSKRALEAMSRLGFKEACEIKGGINQWRTEGLPITR
jgi:phage shock protein E